MADKTQEANIIVAAQRASALWRSAFNAGDAAGCAAQYENDATMHARPFGTFRGTAEIEGFWKNIIDQGYGEVEYIDPDISPVDANGAVLTSRWRMNKASGVIHKELWVMQPDGTAKVREDDFEVTG